MFERIKKWYAQGLWSEAMVAKALAKCAITEKQYKEIIGEAYK